MKPVEDGKDGAIHYVLITPERGPTYSSHHDSSTAAVGFP